MEITSAKIRELADCCPANKLDILKSAGERLMNDEAFLESFQNDPFNVLEGEGFELPQELKDKLGELQGAGGETSAIGVAIAVAVGVFLAPMGDAN